MIRQIFRHRSGSIARSAQGDAWMVTFPGQPYAEDTVLTVADGRYLIDRWLDAQQD